MSSDFQTAVKRNVSKDSRRKAIDRLVEKRDAKNLGVLVRTGGLVGELRRHALEGLGRCSATSELESIAGDRTVESSLRDRAAELA